MTILDPYLASRIHLLEERSPRFREAMLRARDSRIPIVLGTPDQLRQRTALPFLVHEKQATDRVGELLVQKCAPGSAGIRLIVVRVHLERLRSAARWPALLGRGRRWLDSTTDAVLIHEIWGHLTPILLAGDLSGTCPDPAPGQPPLESCVMQRENDLRRELGLKERRRYALRLPGT